MRAVGQVAAVLLLADRQAEVGARVAAVDALAALRREERDHVVARRDEADALARPSRPRRRPRARARPAHSRTGRRRRRCRGRCGRRRRRRAAPAPRPRAGRPARPPAPRAARRTPPGPRRASSSFRPPRFAWRRSYARGVRATGQQHLRRPAPDRPRSACGRPRGASAGAAPGGKPLRPRRRDQAVELPQARVTGISRVARRVEDGGAHLPVGGVVAGASIQPRTSSRAAAGRERARDGPRSSRAGPGGPAALRRSQRDQRPQPPRPAPRCRPGAGRAARRQSPAGESAVTEAAPPGASHLQRRPSRRASCRRRAGRSTPARAQNSGDRRGEVGGARRDPGRQRRRSAEARQVERDHLALGGEPAEDRLPDRPVPPRPWSSSSGSPSPATCASTSRRPDVACARSPPPRPRPLLPPAGFAKSTCTSPIRRSRKPASEELR